ncbi:MAG: hypothetical protein M3246_05745, partial [Actinomycetota bacterium]|nr:hypothetical protein [Actinomycetota bacterium]
ILLNPEELCSDLDRAIELEREGRHGDPEAEARHWLEKLSEIDEERRGFLRLAAKGRITDDELDEELAPLEETRRTAERALEALQWHKERVEQMERDRDAVLSHYAALAPEALDALSPEERHSLYSMLRLSVVVHTDGPLEVSGLLGEVVCTSSPTSRVPPSRDPGSRPPARHPGHHAGCASSPRRTSGLPEG